MISGYVNFSTTTSEIGTTLTFTRDARVADLLRLNKVVYVKLTIADPNGQLIAYGQLLPMNTLGEKFMLGYIEMETGDRVLVMMVNDAEKGPGYYLQAQAVQ